MEMAFPRRTAVAARAAEHTAAALNNSRRSRMVRIFSVFILFSAAVIMNIQTFQYDIDDMKQSLIESLSSVSYATTIITTTKQQEKKHLVYCHLSERQINEKAKNFLCDGWKESNRLIQVNESFIHEPEVIWVTSDFQEIAPLVKTSMQIRLGRRRKSFGDTLSQEELDNIDPQWKIFYYDISDNGIGNGWFWNVNNTISPMVGCKRINFLTRTTQNGRRMQKWVNDVRSGKKDVSMVSSMAKPLNFTDIFEREKLNPACATVQRLSFYVREDIKRAIDDYMEKREKKNSINSSSSKIDLSSHAIAHLPRPTDVRTFWNEKVCNTRCSFRNYVSNSVLRMSLRYPSLKINTDVAGYIRGRGRRRVHPDYIEGMLTTKIIVLAQRDNWEDHYRLDEALLSGALVLHDPQTYWPHMMIDGVNIVVYHNISDLESKILYYLDPLNEEERIAIGQRGRELALNNHRVWNQAERVFLNDMSYHNDYGLYNQPWINGEYSPSL